MRFGADQVIVRQGDPGDAVYAPLEGMAEVWLDDAPQRSVLSDRCSCGRWRAGLLFEGTAVPYHGRRSAAIKAQTGVTTLKLPGPVFPVVRSSPEVALQIAVSLAQRLASDRHTLASDPIDSGTSLVGTARMSSKARLVRPPGSRLGRVAPLRRDRGSTRVGLAVRGGAGLPPFEVTGRVLSGDSPGG